MMRRCATFFPQRESPEMLPEGSNVDDFRLRTKRLLEELASLTKAPSTMWDIRCVGTLLEYCNCLWLKAQDRSRAAVGAEPTAELEAAGDDLPSSERMSEAWVAL